MSKLSIAFVLLICGVFLGCATNFQPANPDAFGTRWTFLGVDTEKIQYFYDPANVTYSGSITKFKVRGVGAMGYEIIGWFEFDCMRNTLRSFDNERYDKYYRSVGQVPDEPWQGIVRNSVLDQNRSRFCK